jgi:hypothetical protein
MAWNQNVSSPTSAQSTATYSPTKRATVVNLGTTTAIPNAAPAEPLKKVCTVNHNVLVQKLPRGQNLITMSRQDLATIQIKLPATEKSQHWCTIKVDGREGSVQCPDSSLALKVAVLQQASSLAMKEKTTVRIPITVAGEVQTFGVYAVPGLQTHVFVGPFSNKDALGDDDDDDIICLDQPSAQPPAQIMEEDDDDIAEVVEEEQPEKEDIVAKDIGQEAIKVDKVAKARERLRAIMGQVPQMVIKAPKEEDRQDVNIDEPMEMPLVINEDDPDEVENEPAYLNPSSNPHGRVIYSPDPNRVDFYEKSEDQKLIYMNVDSYGKLRVFSGNNIVSFMHPVLKKHEVICQNLNKAKLWIETYMKQIKEKTDDDDLVDHEGEENAMQTTQESQPKQTSPPPPPTTTTTANMLAMKPMSALMDESRPTSNASPPPMMGKQKLIVSNKTENPSCPYVRALY